MFYTLRILIISLFFSSPLLTKEIFIDQDDLNLGHITQSYKYCKSIKPSHKLCKSKKLTYLDYEDPKLPNALRGIKAHIAPIVKKYNAHDIKTSVLRDMKDMGGAFSGDWYNEIFIDLFAKTPATYTLSSASNGYEGGAHGYYHLGLVNYDVKSHTKLTLDNLFLPDSNQSLHRIAQTHYKALVGLAPHQPLTDEGWFDDKFILAENFAITSRGLYFFYNQYEIKPYAAGPTEFMLPYSKIQSIIDPNGALGFALNNDRSFHALFKQDDEISIALDAKVEPNGKIKITAKMKNLSYINRGWLSLSFPQMHAKNPTDSLHKQGFSSVHAYPKGSKVYHQKLKKSVRSSYLLIEGEDNNWNIDKVNTITVTLTPPANKKELILDIRGNLKSKHKNIMLPDPYEGQKGQQGFTNYRVFIEL